jgi:hypothetical protein
MSLWACVWLWYFPHKTGGEKAHGYCLRDQHFVWRSCWPQTKSDEKSRESFVKSKLVVLGYPRYKSGGKDQRKILSMVDEFHGKISKEDPVEFFAL